MSGTFRISTCTLVAAVSSHTHIQTALFACSTGGGGLGGDLGGHPPGNILIVHISAESVVKCGANVNISGNDLF